MSAALHIAALVRNETERFWPTALEAWSSFADRVVVLDDGSDDGSDDLAEAHSNVRLVRRAEVGAWGAEAGARQELFELVWDTARVDDYIFWLDADMVPARDPRVFMDTKADAVCFRLYDLWNTDLDYRHDEFWRGHLVPRVWMIRRTDALSSDFTWDRRGIHVGHLPGDMTFESYAYAPEDYSLLHFAYVHPWLREDKYVQYASVASELTDFEKAHARTILDVSPNLVPLPFYPEISLI